MDTISSDVLRDKIQEFIDANAFIFYEWDKREYEGEIEFHNTNRLSFADLRSFRGVIFTSNLGTKIKIVCNQFKAFEVIYGSNS